MAEPTSKRYAVVTGSNKGIGFEICRQLAANGIVVVLTARDENRGLDAVKKLHNSGLTDFVLFHQLDVADSASVASLAEFIKTQFGKLDILVNNAGISGVVVDAEAMKASMAGKERADQIDWGSFTEQPYEEVERCIETNYYGAKRMVEALIQLLQLSDSPTIVNVSSASGKLQKLSHEWAKQVLSDAESLTEAKVDEVVKVFLEDFRQGSWESKGWPTLLSAYIVSKAAMNGYTRVLAKKYPNIRINCVCPGYVKTDINFNTGFLSVEEGAETPVRLALLSEGGPSGRFFVRKEESEF